MKRPWYRDLTQEYVVYFKENQRKVNERRERSTTNSGEVGVASVKASFV